MAQDIGLLLRGLGAAVSNTVPQFRQEMAQEQQANAMRTQQSLEMQSRNAEMLQARQKAMYQDAESALKLLAAGDLDSIVALGQDRLQLLRNFPDADPSDTARLTQFAMQAKAGDQKAYSSLATELLGTVRRGLSMGILATPEAQQLVVKPGETVLQNGKPIYQAAAAQTAPTPRTEAAKLQADYNAGLINEDQLKAGLGALNQSPTAQAETGEARDYIRLNVTDINKSLGEIASAYNKVVSLEPEMRAGNRSAINAGIMNLARLVSPGVVNEADVARFSGANTSIGALYSFLQGQGVDMNTILQVVDPVNPEVFKPENLMSVARSVTASSIPSLLSRFEDQKNIATQYQLSPQFVSSYLPQNSEIMKSIMAIQRSLESQSAPSTAQSGSTFKSMAEAEQAVAQGIVPIGATVNVVDPNGNVQSFVVEE